MFSKKNTKIDTKEEIKSENDIYSIKIFRRTLENYTHEVIEDNKIKKITSWRKSQSKFLQSLILNIFTLGILHILSLIYPNLYIKLYCNRRKPKECDFFLVEDIYGKLTLCKKIYKKDKTQKNNLTSTSSKEEMISSSFSNIKKSLTRNLTYSFKYKSITYEYDERTNEIKPVYMDLSDLTNKDIFHYFSEGLSSEDIIKIFHDRYGKNEYILNLNISSLYLFRVELPHLIFIIIVGVIELTLGDLVSFITKITFIVIIKIAGYITLKKNIDEPYKNEYTLDGEKHKIRVKRDYKLKEKTEIFCNIENCDLLPGDIIFLKSNDIVPCDCLILEGECMADSNNLIGNLNIVRKLSLENKNIPFNYKLNMDNILYHGMKIVKTYSNLKQEYISALCINTGSNTYKANLYSNTLYFFERKKEYEEIYKFLNKERKIFFSICLGIAALPILLSIIYLYVIMSNVSEITDFKNKENRELFITLLIRIICKSTMPIVSLIHETILLLGIWNLKKENVNTLEKSKLLIANNINTIFINKTGTLCNDKLEINSYHPISVSHHNLNNLGFRTYNTNQNKELNLQLVKYYKDYLKKLNELSNPNYKKDKNLDNNKTNLEKANQKCSEYSTLFLESLLSCNNLEKYGMEIFGNSIDSEIFKAMKWDIKADINYSNEINSDLDYSYHKTDTNSFYSKISYYEKERNDIFPSNYYKITESMKNEITNQRTNSNISKDINKIEEEKYDSRDILSKNNTILKDISRNSINSYKLRIYKRFIKDNALSSSSITYNFITKELRFNTKGIPEDILDKCNPFSVPDNFDKLLSYYRRRGFIVIICAGKRLSIEQYTDNDTEDKYMINLTFYGFITLKNRLKPEVIYALNELKEFNCDFIISTGDNIYNSLSVGFESTILENKDIYSFEKDEIKNRIVIKKINNSSGNSNNEEEKNYNEQNNDNINIDYISNLSKSFIKKFDKSNKPSIASGKQSKVFEYSDSSLNSYLKSEKTPGGNKQSLIKGSIVDQSGKKSRMFKKGLLNYSISSTKNILNTNNNSKNSMSLSNAEIKGKLKMSRKNMNSFDFNFLDTPLKSSISVKNNLIEKNEFLYYYQEIFEDHKELSEDCIYCVDSKVFDFLYKNKNKRHAKILLEKIHEKCRIFYNMTALTKSKIIDYYREFKDKCICTIGQCQSDIDQIFSSDIGINLQPPRNSNTILCHFYSPDSNLLTIKKIIRAGRAINENIILIRLSGGLYTIIINSYILCCFMRQMDVIKGQLNFLEIGYLVLSLCAFTIKSDEEDNNDIINFNKNKKLYIYHYAIQMIGLLVIKCFGIYYLAFKFNTNNFIEKKSIDKIYSTYHFVFCVADLVTTVYVLNLLSIYRKSLFLNTLYIILSLLVFFYFSITISLTSSNFNVDIFDFLYFEYFENIVDAYDENNKVDCFIACLLDFNLSIVYSRLIYYLFARLSKGKSKIDINN